jgi:hypothetical protein
MVGELAARHALPKEVVEGVTERTGGVPLFVEEVTRLLLESGEQRGIQAILPTSCAAPSRCRTAWSSAMRACPRSAASSSVWASISAMLVEETDGAPNRFKNFWTD